jgi:hypothetical protein
MDEAYNTYGDGWDDFIIDVLNGKLKMKFVDYEKQKWEAA